MVAKINRGASLYGAIAYNQQKVGDSHARIISGNRMIADITDSPERLMQRTMWAFESYLLANRNTEKPILHISLNPSPEDKLTDAQFANLAKEYMDKMGYGDQPYIVYMHEDIGRRHIHIVSTCVNENGEKIDDAYEWNRSMKACREMERKFGLKQHAEKKDEQFGIYLKKANYTQGDLKRQVSNILKSVFTAYRFQTFGEYSALLSCFNIEAKQVKGEYGGIPYTGIVYAVTDDNGKAVSAPIKSSLIDKRFGYQGGWRNGSDTTPGSSRRRNGNRKSGTRWHLPCTAAWAARKPSRICCVNGALTRFLEPMMKAASTGSRLSTITTRRYTTVPGWEKNFPPTCSRSCSALRKMPSCCKPPCSMRICSRSAAATWRVPSSRPSACFLSMLTVLTRKRKHSRECCKRRKRKNAVHAAFHNPIIHSIKTIRLCNKKTTFADWPRQWSSCGPYPSCF